MKAYCLASSSHGNCFIFEFNINGVPTQLMVECGIPLKEIYARTMTADTNIYISNIKACLVTHAHSDHSKAARDLAKRGIPVFATKPTLSALNIEGEELVELQPKRVCDGVSVLAFAVEHDCEGSVGFVIKTQEECVIFINDHKKWNDNLSAFKPNYVFIECNYFHKIVYAQLYELKKKTELTLEERQRMKQHERNINAHCSLNGTIKGLKKLNLSKCEFIVLTHLSDRYANEYEMKNQVQAATGIRTLVAGKNGGIK